MDKFDFIGMVTLIVFALFVFLIYRLVFRKHEHEGKNREVGRAKFKKFEALVMISGFIIVIAISLLTVKYVLNDNKPTEQQSTESKMKYTENKFEDTLDYKMLEACNLKYEGENYLISPYSMTIALEMLRDGAKGETRQEIEEILGNKELIERINVKGRVATSNALFIKEDYKNDILESYNNLIKDTYDGEILYDTFETPKVINDWVTDNTYEMIVDPLKEIDKSFILGIFNALAIDVEWDSIFKCENTREETFTTDDDEYKVEMMHQEYQNNAKYFETKYSKGVILPYNTYDEDGKESDEGTTLEFIGILPEIDLKDYIELNLSNDYLEIDKKIKSVSEDTRLELSLPRFEYDFNFDEFAESLKEIGVEKAFTSEADFSNISETINDLNVGNAIHQTYIKLGETGTKAAAVTGFIMAGSAYQPEKYKIIEIKFNKPFLYIIRDSKTKENLFIGTVYKPNIWKKSTCENE